VPGDAADDAAEDVPAPLPPLHQEAVDAIERGDLAAAGAAYEKAMKQSPADEEARLGLSQVRLMERTQAMDPAVVRQQAADAPTDVAAQIAAADLDLVGGHVEDAFARLIDLVRVTSADERKTAREHLISLFDVIGAQDPRVSAARRALTNALF
ncbi:MAG: tetratricopeptide repeat protein, partial [Ornithinimicrobium sp.]